MLFIGLMSGTSVDAIDAALVRIERHPTWLFTARVLQHTELAWPAAIRTRLLAAMAPAATTTEEICQLNYLVAREFARAVEKLLLVSKTPRVKITAIGSHGQTVCHLPPAPAKPKIKNPKSQIPSTLQLGDDSVLATLTGIPTVANFRTADMALGGQGAPLVPFADAILLTHSTKNRAIQNIGGIANVTFLPAQDKPRDGNPGLSRSMRSTQLDSRAILAFDTGPGNMLLDAVVSLATHNKKSFDKNGALAAKGKLDGSLLAKLQANPYFAQRPPKSTGRELFGQQFATQLLTGHWPLTTLLHTLTRLTAWSIAHAYRLYLPASPDEVILCGGGAQNLTLVRMLQEELDQLPTRPKILSIDDFGIPNKSKEAASFALLAAATWHRVPSNIPSVTGATRSTLLGQIAFPCPK